MADHTLDPLLETVHYQETALRAQARTQDQPIYPQDVDEVLKRKRKPREHKACYPCRQRKVKCNLSRPCDTCQSRQHPELCTYEPPNKRQQVETDNITIGRRDYETLLQKLSSLENSIVGLRRELGTQIDPSLSRLPHEAFHGIHQPNSVGITHFSASSIPTMLHAMNSSDQEVSKSILPLFCMDGDSATYPFIDLWGLPHGSLQRAQELAKVLPDDQQTLSLIRDYRELAYVLYPGVADFDAFNDKLMEFLIDRTTGDVDEREVYGKSYYWLGLLFAVLASGAQCSKMPRKQRELTSQVYLCCAMECCRFTNFLSRSNLETIQTLLVVQNVLSNNMNAGTAWAMLGLSLRLAQGQGLHQPCRPDVPSSHTFKRSKIWWAAVWQDSMLSTIYDRAGGVELGGGMPMPQTYGEVSSYLQSNHKLARITLDIIQDRALFPDSHGFQLQTKLENFYGKITAILDETAPHLKDVRSCTTTQQSLEYWELRMQSSYVIAELCRPALNPARGVTLRNECIKNLLNTVEAYLGLEQLTTYARQSWPSIHRALTSSLLLSILGVHDEVVGKFLLAMEQITEDADSTAIGRPLQRGVDALRKLISTRHDSTQLSTLITPPRSGNDELLPHSVVNDILFGAKGPAGNPMQRPMPW